MSPRDEARKLEMRYGFRRVFSASVNALGYPWITHYFEATVVTRELLKNGF